MKIRYLTPDSHKIGGIQKFALSIAKTINESDGFSVRVSDYQYQISYLRSIVADLSPGWMRRFVTETVIAPYLRSQNQLTAETLYHCWHIDAAMYLPRTARFMLTTHGLEILPKSLNQTWCRQMLSTRAIESAAGISCDSEYTRQLLLESFPNVKKDKLRIIYPPINISSYQQKKVRNAKKEFVIGTLCRLVTRKNVSGIIRALEILHARMPLFTYHLVGTGPEQESILEQLKKVSFSWKHQEQLSEDEKNTAFFPSLDLFVMPTLELPNDVEGFGIVYIEANASGVPVISSRSGGAAEATKDGVTGLFADPADPAHIAHQIERALQMKFSQDKLLAWAQKFDLQVIADQFKEMYRELNASTID